MIKDKMYICIIDDNRILFLDKGVDDFILNSKSFGDLVARIRSRFQDENLSFMQIQSDCESKNELNGFRVDNLNNTIIVDNVILNLTVTEFRILSTLIRNQDIFVDKPYLEDIALGWRTDGHSRALHSHIVRIRHKLSKVNSKYSKAIVQKKGYGVKLVHVDCAV